MRYLGGKDRIAKWVMTNILLVQNDCTRYVEPFVGSAAVFSRVAPYFKEAEAYDAHLDLVLMWKALGNGWKPPTRVSRDEYEFLKSSEPSALRGFVGYGCSFGGKWFGGYVDKVFDVHVKRWTPVYAETAARSVEKLAHTFEHRTVECLDYKDVKVDSNTLVYCDPPYDDTVGYDAVGTFDSKEFWHVAHQWACQNALVIVSEEKAPKGWSLLATRDRKAMLRVSKDEGNEMRTEKLFWNGSE